MKASSARPLMSTSTSGWASRSFIIGMRLWPPASTQVSGRLSSVSACSTLVARSYSTCEGTCIHSSFGLGGCCATAGAVSARGWLVDDGLEAREVALENLCGLGQQLGFRERLLHQRYVRLQAALGGQHGPG